MKEKFTAILVGTSCAVITHKIAREFIASASSAQWDRTSFSGKTVSLKGGLINAAALSAATFSQFPHPASFAASVATLSGAIAGYIDDHLEDAFPAKGKGFRGHLGALRKGKLSSGMMKIILVGAGSLASSGLIATNEVLRKQTQQKKSNKIAKNLKFTARVVDSTLIIAGTANLFNLLDLRPGRALKIGTFAALPFLFAEKSISGMSSGLIAANLMSLPEDLAGTEMLGDLGANALGAAIGTMISLNNSHLVRATGLVSVIALNIASEKISFSKVIAENKVLNYLDLLGRNKPSEA